MPEEAAEATQGIVKYNNKVFITYLDGFIYIARNNP